jgi:amino-acid N-acetyltransferase
VKHMEKAGFNVTVRDTPDMDGMKQSVGLPVALASCHTAVIGNYLIEGHVPADLVQKFLAEKSAARGLTVPGMVVGSPGMEGATREKYDVLLFEKNGKSRVYASRWVPLTLIRTEAFVAAHLDGYLSTRDANDVLLGCVALDEYSPSLVELVSLAVAPLAQGLGLGKRMIEAACSLAERRGYPQIFAISLADALFLTMGFVDSNISHFPEKIARYTKISRSELSIGKKFCFVRMLNPLTRTSH